MVTKKSNVTVTLRYLFLVTLNSLVNSSSVLGITLRKGNITYKDVNKIFPQNNTVDRVVMSGTTLLKVFFASVVPHKNKPEGKLHETPAFHFQVSGLKVTFDNDQVNPRVESIKTACKIQKECSPIQIRKWCQLNLTRNYTIAMSSEFVGENGTGVGIFSGLILDLETGDTEKKVFSNFVKECSPMKQVLDGRIVNHVSKKSM